MSKNYKFITISHRFMLVQGVQHRQVNLALKKIKLEKRESGLWKPYLNGLRKYE